MENGWCTHTRTHTGERRCNLMHYWSLDIGASLGLKGKRGFGEWGGGVNFTVFACRVQQEADGLHLGDHAVVFLVVLHPTPHSLPFTFNGQWWFISATTLSVTESLPSRKWSRLCFSLLQDDGLQQDSLDHFTPICTLGPKGMMR